MEVKLILVVALLVGSSSAGPTGTRFSDCSATCDAATKFFYEVGRKYEYEYAAETRTGIQGVTNEDSLVRATALATIQPVSQCEFLLSLTNVRLDASARTQEFSDELSRHPLRFSFQNGRIEHVCAADDEPMWVLNFKKGVLSNLQNSMEDLMVDEVVSEKDVSGMCQTSYTSAFENEQAIVTRTKVPSECSSQNAEKRFSTFGYSLDSFVQGLPLISSTQTCRQIISGEFIQEVTCHEEHLFVPFQRNGEGAITTTRTSMKLVATKTASSPYLESFRTRSELVFESMDDEDMGAQQEEASSIVANLESLTENGIEKAVPETFSKLVLSLRNLRKHQILSIVESSNARGRSFVKDALPLVNTAEAMGAFVNMILDGVLSEKERDVWFTSLAFVKKPTPDMFEQLLPLFNEVVEDNAILGVSSMIHNYCSKNTNCGDVDGIAALISHIESHLGNGCRSTTSNEQNTILFALKALGNAGVFVNAESVLKRCYLENNAMEVRLAAIDAWRRVSCDHDRAHFLQTFTDETQDNEIRIAAYLAVMKCPNQDLIDTLKDRLVSDGVNQVASFVWTHLSNLQESAAPEKQWIRSLIGDDVLQNKFSSDSLKMSKNYESSFYLTEQQFGGSADSNVIFSQRSFLPRSSMLNFTIDLFGQPINIFEVGGRIESLEAYIEKFFGPNGYYPEETVEAIIKNLRQKGNDEVTSVESLLVRDDEDPKGSLYLRLFGNEIFYKNFKGIENIFPEMTLPDIFEIIMEIATTGKADYTKSIDMVDSEFSFPTITGFPIKLNLKGAATIGFKIDGKFSMESIRNVNIKGKVHPSTTININSQMFVDAFVSKSGVKLISSLHSSTSLEGEATINEGKLIHFSFNVPNEKIEVINVENELFTINYDKESRIEPSEANTEICKPFICKYLGVDICFEKSTMSPYSKPYFPLSGPYKMKISFERTDSHTGYIFHYEKNPQKILTYLEMSESQYPKKWGMELSKETNGYSFDLQSPHGNSNGNILFTYKDDQIQLESEMNLNAEKIYDLKFNIARNIGTTNRKATAKLYIESSMLTGTLLDLKADYAFDKITKSIDAGISLQGNRLPTVRANIILDRRTTVNTLKFGIFSAPFEMSFSGLVGPLTSSGRLNLNGNYRLYNNPPESLTTALSYNVEKTDSLIVYSGEAEITELDFKTSLQLEASRVSSQLKISGNLMDKTWDVEQHYSYIRTDKFTEFKFKTMANVPHKYINFNLESYSKFTDKEAIVEKSVKLNDISQSKKILWIYGESFKADVLISHMRDYSIHAEVNKIERGSYNLQYSHDLPRLGKKRLESSLDTNVSGNSFDFELKGLYNDVSLVTSAYDFIWTLKANPSSLDSQVNLNCDGTNCFLNLKATPLSLAVDSNLLKPFTLNAEVKPTGEEKTVSIKSKYDGTPFEATGRLSPKLLEGNIKYEDTEMYLTAKLMERGFQFEAQTSPKNRFAVFADYNFTPEETSLELGLETPFAGWEKQDASFNFKPSASDIQGQASLTWQNVHHISLTLKGTAIPSPDDVNYTGNLRFTSTLENYENMELTINHKRDVYDIKKISTLVDGKWNSEVIRGNFEYRYKENSHKADFSFKSPFTDDLVVSSDVKLTFEDISGSLNAVYGSNKSTILFKGNMIDLKNMSGTFVCSSPFLPEVKVNALIQMGSTNKSIEIKGKYNENKSVFAFSCDKFMDNESHVCNMNAKLVTNSEKLFNFNFSNKMRVRNGFETDLEVSSSLLSVQAVKGHIEGTFSTLKSASLTGFISGPEISGRINMNHKVTNNKLNTDFDVELNKLKFSVLFEGNIDLENYEATANGETSSNISEMDGIKMTLKHKRVDDKLRETQFNVNRKTFALKVNHSFKFENYLNWYNFLSINDMYTIKNNMMSTSSSMKHSSDFGWNTNKLEFMFEGKWEDKLEITSFFNSPWTSLLKLALQHEKENTINNSEIMFEYGDGKTLHMRCSCESLYGSSISKTVKIMIQNEDWNLNSLTISLNSKAAEEKSIDFTFSLNDSYKMMLNLFSDSRTRGGNLYVNADSFLNAPLSFILKYSGIENERNAFIEFKSHKTYSLDLKQSGTLHSGTIFSTLSVPQFAEIIKTNANYNFRSYFDIDVKSVVGNKVYKLEGKLEGTEFFMKTSTPTTKGSLKINVKYNENDNEFKLIFKSPFDFFKDTEFVLRHNVHPKTLYAKMVYGEHRINVQGKMNHKQVQLECNTTFDEFRAMTMNLEFYENEIIGTFSKDKDTIKLIGKGNFDYNTGEANLDISLPVSGYENNKLSIKYSFQKDIYVNLKTTIGSKYLKFHIESNFDNYKTKTLLLDIETPFKLMEKLIFEAALKNDSLTLSGNFNKHRFESLMKMEFNSISDGGIIFKLESTMPKWTTFSIEADINCSRNPYMLSLKVKDEDTPRNYKIVVDKKGDYFNVDIETPIPTFENIKIKGNGKYEENKLQSSITFQRNSYATNFSGHVNFNNILPEIEFNIVTPYENMEKINFVFNASISDEKLINSMLTVGEKTFSVKLYANLFTTNGKASFIIKTPITEYEHFNLNLSYDTENKEKYITIQKQHNDSLELYSLKGKVEFNNFDIKIDTPIPEFKNLVLSGKLEKYGNGYNAVGKVLCNDELYNFNAYIDKNENGYEAETVFPVSDNDSVGIKVRINDEGVVIKTTKGNTVSEVIINYSLKPNNAFIEITTPFESFSHLSIGGEYKLHKSSASYKIYVQKNSENLQVYGNVDASPLSMNIKMGIDLPSNGNYLLHMLYDIDSIEKIAKLTLQSGNEITEYSVKALYDGINKGFIKITTPIEGYKSTGFEYIFRAKELKNTEAFITIFKNSKEYSIGLESVIKEKKISILLKTPFTEFRKVGIAGQFDMEKRSGMSKIYLGEYNLGFETSIHFDDLFIKFETPFEKFRNFEIISKYGLNGKEYFSRQKISYNNISYEFEIIAQEERNNPELILKIRTPHEIINNLEVSAKLNLKSSLNSINVGMMLNSKLYKISLGYEYERSKLSLNFDLTTPIQNWTHSNLFANIDLINETKIINISLQREGQTKSVYLSGNLFENEVEFNINTPFESVGNFRTKGALSRSKRSLDFQMMNDQQSGGISASFNSLKIKATTPFSKAKDVSFELSKDGKGSWLLNYKRNGDAVFGKIHVEKKPKGFKISVESKIPGWELVALSGRLEPEQAMGYLTGKLNSEMVSISGSGFFKEKTGFLTITGTSTYPKFKNVVTKIEYNTKTKVFRFKSNTKSSNFNFFIEFKKGTLKIDILVPHLEKDTVINGKLQFFKGSLTASSRFDRYQSFSLSYELGLNEIITAKSLIKRNEITLFELDAKRDIVKNMAHIKIDARRGENHSELHFHREGFKTLEFSFKRNMKTFIVEINGTGDLPRKGKYDISITNSFRATPRTVSAKIELDRSSSPKNIKLRLVWHDGKVYISNLIYNIDLKNWRNKGDFKLNTVTPNRDMRPWKSIGASWKFNNAGKGNLNVNISRIEINFEGTIKSWNDVNLISSSLPEKYYLQWKLYKTDLGERNYFMKIGREGRFIKLKFQGNFGPDGGDVKGAFQFSRFMQNEFKFTNKWTRTKNGLTEDGTFTIGEHSGTHKLLKFKRDPIERAADIHWEMTSNIDDYKKVTLKGNYNLAKRDINMTLSWDTDKIYIKGKLSNLTLRKSENTIQLALPGYGEGQIIMSHDFTNPTKRSFKVSGKIGTKEILYEGNWTRNGDLTKLDFIGNVNSPILGTISMIADYDIRDINNAKGKLHYKRNLDKFVNIDWSRIKTDVSLKDEWSLSSYGHNASVFLKAYWAKGLELDAGIKVNETELGATLSVGEMKTLAQITTPFPKISNIRIVIEYDLKKKDTKKVSIKYSRGTRKAEITLELKTINKKRGSLNISLTSPFEMFKTLDINANWKKGNMNVLYKRNDVTVKIDGKVEVKTDMSSILIKFMPPSGYPVQIEFSHDITSFKSGKSTPNDLVHAKLQIRGHTVQFDVKGFRTEEKLFLELRGTSTLEKANNFYVKLDSELNLKNREGLLEVKVDEMFLEIKNTFEKHETGFYARSQIKSSLTKLPGLTVGFGKQGDSFILTTGLGDEREISFTLQGIDRYEKGFSGKIDIPRHGISGLEYSVEYDFISENILKATYKLKVAEGQYIEADITYDSDGVRSRLSSPWHGAYRARARRSITENHFMADVGVNDYALTFEGDINESSSKKGFRVSGSILGHKILTEGFININGVSDSEGKFIISTPFKNYEKIGGYFLNKLTKQSLLTKINIYSVNPFTFQAKLDLGDKLTGTIIMAYQEFVYNIDCDFTADSKNVLNGSIVINAPHSTFKKILINGYIKSMSTNNLEGSFNIELPTGVSSFDILMKVDRPVYTFDMSVRTPSISEFRWISNYSVVTKPFYIKGNTKVNLNKEALYSSNTEIEFNGFDNMGIKYELNYNPTEFYGLVDLNSNNENTNGEILLKLFNKHALKLSISVPTQYDQITFEGFYDDKIKHEFYFQFSQEVNSKNFIFKANIPTFANVDIESEIYSSGFQVKSMIKTNVGTKVFNLQYQNYKVTVESKTNSPLLQEKLNYFVEINGLRECTVNVDYGSISHVFYGKLDNIGTLSKIHLNIQSPILRYGDINIIASYNFERKYLIEIETILFGTKNKIYFALDKEFILTCVSPYVPTGFAKIQGKLDLDTFKQTLKDLHVIASFSNAHDTYLFEGKLKFDIESESEVYMNIRTPFEDYENVKLGLTYVTKDLTSIHIFAYPLNYNAKAYFGIQSSVFVTGFDIQTGSGKNKLTKAEVYVPLNRFEPSFSTYFNEMDYELKTKINDTKYGAEVSFETVNLGLPSIDLAYQAKAPYEIHFNSKNRAGPDMKFGVIFDSSFFVLRNEFRRQLGQLAATILA